MDEQDVTVEEKLADAEREVRWLREALADIAFKQPTDPAALARAALADYSFGTDPDDRIERLFCAALVSAGDVDHMNAVLRRYLAWRDGREPEPTWAFPQGG